MRRTLIAGNWKMNGSLAANDVLLAGLKQGVGDDLVDVAVCVPAPYLAQCAAALQGTSIRLGAQDVSTSVSGAYTGEVSGAMLQDFGCRYVIVGHSERRSYHGETSAVVARKALAALAAGLTPIVCVGETLDERDAERTAAVVGAQLDAVLDAVAATDLAKLVIAYEPVWAIGTGKTATPQMAQAVHAVLRARLAARDAEAASQVQILYGGSMKPDNAADLLAMADIDGGLIGGAALKAADFNAIIAAARQ
ncbi:MAG: triose-phosphate isomerase [Herminiimonas sp.]|nr:triose-phosphate isomerase [Herminiimonas sp.]